MTGAVLIKPWERALKANGVTLNCLTSRVLNQIERVVLAAEKHLADGNSGASLAPEHHAAR